MANLAAQAIDPEHSRLRAARFAVIVVFLMNGFTLGNWFVRIPAVKGNIGLSDAQLGLALLGMPVGALVVMSLTGGWIARHGSRGAVWVGTLALAALVILPSLAGSLWGLFGALAVLGAANGIQDVSMNTHAISVERFYHRSIISSFHACFSIGSLFGALTGGLAAGIGLDPRWHLGLVGLSMLALAPFALRGWLGPEVDIVRTAGREPFFVSVPLVVVLLGIIATASFMVEGAMADWTAIYLERDIGTGAGMAAGGFAAFSLTMSVFRLLGDRVIDWLGWLRSIRFGAIVAAIGVGIAVAVQSPWPVLVGFGLTGVGISIIAPVTFSAAGRTPGVAPSRSIAVVTTIGYVGFMAGPPVIGFVAHALQLRGALALVVVLCLLMLPLAWVVQRRS